MKHVFTIFLYLNISSNLFAQMPALEWANGAGSGGSDAVTGVVTAADGSVYITGYFTGTTNFNPSGTANLVSAGDEDIFIAKYSSTGNYQWAYRIGGTAGDRATDIAIDDSNHLAICGYFSSTSMDLDPGPGSEFVSPSNTDFFIVKLDSSGSFLLGFRIGSGTPDYCNSVALDDSSNIFVTGKFYGSIDFDPSSGFSYVYKMTPFYTSDIFLAKYSGGGVLRWAMGIGGNDDEDSRDVIADDSGNAMITGFFRGAGIDFDYSAATAFLNAVDSSDIFIARYSRDGNYEWAISIGGSDNDWGNSLALDSSGNILLTGIFHGANVDFDPGSSMHALTAAGSADFFVARYSSSGNYLGAFGAGGTGWDEGKAITCESNGKVLLAGIFSSAVDFDPGTSASVLTSYGNQDAFIAHYDSSGAYRFAFQMGGTGIDQANCLAIRNASIFAGGFFYGSADFDPGAGTANLTSSGNADLFLSAFHYFPSAIRVPERCDITVYPNPATDVIYVNGEGNYYDLELLNSHGCIVRSALHQLTLNVSGLPAGLYFWRIVRNNEIIARDKIVIQH